MRTSIISSIAMLTVCISGENVFCQSTNKTKVVKTYDAIVTLSTQENEIVGVLDAVGDSALYLVGREGKITIRAEVIDQIKVKRKGSVGVGALTGGLAGMLLGSILGYADGDDQCDGWCMEVTAEQKMGFGAIVGAGLGSVIGVMFGRKPAEKIIIAGSQETYSQNVALLRKYSLSQTE